MSFDLLFLIQSLHFFLQKCQSNSLIFKLHLLIPFALLLSPQTTQIIDADSGYSDSTLPLVRSIPLKTSIFVFQDISSQNRRILGVQIEFLLTTLNHWELDIKTSEALL